MARNDNIYGGSAPVPPRFIAFVSKRAAALRRKRKRRIAPPSCKPTTALRSLLSVALSSVVVKHL